MKSQQPDLEESSKFRGTIDSVVGGLIGLGAFADASMGLAYAAAGSGAAALGLGYEAYNAFTNKPTNGHGYLAASIGMGVSAANRIMETGSVGAGIIDGVLAGLFYWNFKRSKKYQ